MIPDAGCTDPLTRTCLACFSLYYGLAADSTHFVLRWSLLWTILNIHLISAFILEALILYVLIYETNIFSLCITDWSRTIMKKKVITLLLAVVLASGSVGNVPVMAAEAT